MNDIGKNNERIKAINKRNKAERRARMRDSGRGPARDPIYRKWISTLPCVVCFTAANQCSDFDEFAQLYADLILHSYEWPEAFRYASECAHVGERGLGQKCSDYITMPLCVKHHERGYPESHHALGKRFWEYHLIDRDGVTSLLQRCYRLLGNDS